MFDLIRGLCCTVGFIVFAVIMVFFALLFSVFDILQTIAGFFAKPIPVGPFILMCLIAIAIALPLGYIHSRIALYYFKKHPEVKRPAWVVKKIGPSNLND